MCRGRMCLLVKECQNASQVNRDCKLYFPLHLELTCTTTYMRVSTWLEHFRSLTWQNTLESGMKLKHKWPNAGGLLDTGHGTSTPWPWCHQFPFAGIHCGLGTHQCCLRTDLRTHIRHAEVWCWENFSLPGPLGRNRYVAEKTLTQTKYAMSLLLPQMPSLTTENQCRTCHSQA